MGKAPARHCSFANAVSDAIRAFARHILQSEFENLPAAARGAVQSFALDTLAVGVAGRSAPHADAICNAAAAGGAAEEAAVWGRALRLPAAAAAFVNAYQAHASEFDCIHEAAVVHPVSATLPPLLAFAEREGPVSGRALALALALAVDVAAGLGEAARGGLRFFRPANASLFGAVAGLGKLARLSEAQLLDGFGLALAQVAGTMQAHEEGKPTLAFQMACAARAALLAVDLARAGFPGPHAVLEGRFGYFPLFEPQRELQPVLESLGRRWRIAEVSHKPWPSGRATHAGIAGLLQLRSAHGISPEQVQRAEICVPPLVMQLVGRPARADMTPNYARLCLPWCGAVALLRGQVGLADFETGTLNDAAALKLAQRIALRESGSDPEALAPQRIALHLNSGAVHTLNIAAAPGGPAAPLAQAAQLHKLHACFQHGAANSAQARAEAGALAQRVEALGEIRDCRELIAPLHAGGAK
ncbi:MAG: MmgE/PrpD family protein [Deltaproteobacteria bacterium]|nr:MmgE/PrpD family protein [Deltaproteobacteria bacterium]